VPDVHPALRDRVASIAIFDNDGGANHVLPSTSAVLGCQLSGHVHTAEQPLSRIGITGIQPTLRTYTYAPATRSVLVRFTPQGAICLGVPAWDLASRSLALADVLGPSHDVLARIDESRDPLRAIGVIEQFLLARPFPFDRVVERAIALIRPGLDEDRQIAAISRTLSISERQLERRFRDRVGMSPKRFASLRRFERAVQIAASSRSLTRAAMEAGYYDQPHFNRDFRRFAGMTPRAWLQMSASYK
jgi:AraC-like DNA-binding protein